MEIHDRGTSLFVGEGKKQIVRKRDKKQKEPCATLIRKEYIKMVFGSFFEMKAAAKTSAIYVSINFLTCFITCEIGWYNTSMITKLPIPCTRSHGIPAIHQATATRKPFINPPSAAPTKIYGIAPKKPKSNPYMPEKMLKRSEEGTARSRSLNCRSTKLLL